MITTVSMASRSDASASGLAADATGAKVVAPASPIAAAPTAAARPPSNRRRSGERGLSAPREFSLISSSSCCAAGPFRRLSDSLAPAALLHRSLLVGGWNDGTGHRRYVVS